MTATPDDSPTVSRLPLVAVGAIIVLAVITALAMGLRGNESFPEGSPEAALQDFLEAALAGDEDAVLALIDPSQRAGCKDEVDRYGDRWSSGEVGFELDEVVDYADHSEIEVTQRQRSGTDPFEGPGWRTNYTFDLVSIDDEWFVAHAPWPWWADRCTTER